MADELGLELRRRGSGKKLHFGRNTGEPLISAWMAENALVTWISQPDPWVVEDQLIEYFDVPLNLKGNKNNAFHPYLSEIREIAKARARALPILAV